MIFNMCSCEWMKSCVNVWKERGEEYKQHNVKHHLKESEFCNNLAAHSEGLIS